MYLLLQPELQNIESTKLPVENSEILQLITFQRMFLKTIRREKLNSMQVIVSRVIKNL